MWQDQGLTRTRTNAAGAQEKYIQIVLDGWDGIVTADRKPQRDYWETKAVYAPVATPEEPVRFRLGQPSVRVPIRNDYDFTDLSTVGIRWSVMAEDRELAKGEGKVSAIPHSTGYLSLPLDSIRTIEPGETYYTHLEFLRPDGSEITTRAVELLAEGPAPEPVRASQPPIRVRSGKTVAITAGAATYEFDPNSGQLMAASAGGAKLIAGARFTLWRPMNANDAVLVRTRLADIPDLNKYQTVLKSWKLAESAADVRIEVEAEYVVNERNSFAVSYVYQIGRDGTLRVQYTVRPRVEAGFLPEIGMELDTAPGLDKLRWLGLGPLDAYPNEKAAPILGVYAGRAGSDTAKGTKAIRWAELTSDQGAGVRVEESGYLRLEGRALRVLPSVAGRPEKGRRPEAPEYRLDTGPSAAFQGGFALSLVSPEKK